MPTNIFTDKQPSDLRVDCRRPKGLAPDMVEPLRESFFTRVDKGSDGDCWEWQGIRNEHRYGRLKLRGGWLLAHRVSVALSGRTIPEGAMVCHSCDNPPCVNPNHLFVGSGRDNMADCVKKGRTHKWGGARSGVKNPAAKVTPEIVRAIRARNGVIPQKRTAEEFGIAQSTVSMIVNGYNWGDVE